MEQTREISEKIKHPERPLTAITFHKTREAWMGSKGGEQGREAREGGKGGGRGRVAMDGSKSKKITQKCRKTSKFSGKNLGRICIWLGIGGWWLLRVVGPGGGAVGVCYVLGVGYVVGVGYVFGVGYVLGTGHVVGVGYVFGAGYVLGL